MSDKLADRIIILVCIVWAVNFAAQFIRPIYYRPDPGINGIFLATVGVAFAAKATRAARRNGKSKDDKRD